jgi:tetratricopeptide (TPR) repeat protein
VSSWSYALTQFPAIVRYLRLCFWPDPLNFDYGSFHEMPPLRAVPYAFVVAGLWAATTWALVRRPAIGFLGVCFFAILAPSSSVVPVGTETIAEHRMYLPLIPVVMLVVAGIHRWLHRATLPICLVMAAVLAWATWNRNEVYRSDEAIWSDSVTQLPENERSQYNLGYVLQRIPGRMNEAIAHLEEALRLNPRLYVAYSNLGNALASAGRIPEVISLYEGALRLNPGLADVHNNLGNALSSLGRTPEAIRHYEEAIRLKPDYAEAQNDLGCGLATTPGRLDEAIAHFEAAVRLKPDYYQARYNLGNALESMGRTPEAIAQYEEASRIKPDDATIHFYLARLLLKTPGRSSEAAAHLREVMRLQPDNDRARQILDQIGEARQ